eukprot:g6016.t1
MKLGTTADELREALGAAGFPLGQCELSMRKGSKSSAYAFARLPPADPASAGAVAAFVERCKAEPLVLAGASVAVQVAAAPTPRTMLTEEERAAKAKAKGEAKAARKKAKEFKTRPCWSWAEAGSCQYGDACKFAHDSAELRDSEGGVCAARDFLRAQAEARQTVTGRCQSAAALAGAGAASGAGGAGGAGGASGEAGQQGGGGDAGAMLATPTCKFGSLIERYYTQLYLCGTDGDGRRNDMYVNVHSNKLCVVGIAPSHALLERTAAGACPATAATKVVFRHTDSGDAAGGSGAGAGAGGGGASSSASSSSSSSSSSAKPQSKSFKLSGKRKKGAPFLNAGEVCATVHCADGSSFDVRSPIKGSLIEVNHRCAEDPSLLTGLPGTDGFLMIMMPKITELPRILKRLSSQADYTAYRRLLSDKDQEEEKEEGKDKQAPAAAAGAAEEATAGLTAAGATAAAAAGSEDGGDEGNGGGSGGKRQKTA